MAAAMLALAGFVATAAALEAGGSACASNVCAALRAEPEAGPEQHVHLVQLRARHDRDARSRARQPKPAAFWSGKNGDVLRSGASSFVAPSKLEAGPTWSWKAPMNDVVRTAPLIDADQNIYAVAVETGGLYKFARNGSTVWNIKLPGSVPVVPALLDGSIFAVTTTGHVHAVDAETGRELWTSQKLCDSVGGDTASVTAAEGLVVVAACEEDKNGGATDIIALSVTDGAEQWRFKPVEKAYNFLSAVQDGKLVFADSTGHVYVLSLANGTQVWGRMSNHYIESPEFSTGGAVIGPNGVVYVTANTREIRDMIGQEPGTIYGRIVAFRLVDGFRLWEADVPCPANAGPAVGRLGGDGMGPLSVVFGCGENPEVPLQPLRTATPKEGWVFAFDAETGEQRWNHSLPVWVPGVAAGDTLIPPHVCLPDSFSNPAIGGDGTVYIGFQSGSLLAIREAGEVASDGKQAVSVSSFDTGAAFQGSPGIAPGMLVATPCDGVRVWLA